jgi:hypothetical protein
MNLTSLSKPVVSLFVLALAATGLGCAAPTETSAPPAQQVGQVQQPVVAQALSGIVGIVNVTSMINQQVKYGRQITTSVVYDETLRLQSDIAALRSSVNTQFNAVLTAQAASDVRAIESAISDYWDTRRDVMPGSEAAFYTDVRGQGQLTFGKLNQLHTILMGDSMGSGLIDLTASAMRKIFSGGSANTDSANALGELVLHMRLIQLQGFEILSQAYASSPTYTGYINIQAKRDEFLAKLAAQEDAFFRAMTDYNTWAVNTDVTWWGAYDRAEGLRMRNQLTTSLWRREPVVKDWNYVQEGSGLDVTPLISIVDARYGGIDVSGSLAKMCNRVGVCDTTFSVAAIGMQPYASGQAPLELTYRCEGIARTTTMTVSNADGKRIYLECRKSQSFIGNYTGDPSGKRLTISSIYGNDDAIMTAAEPGLYGKVWSGRCTLDETNKTLSCSSPEKSTWTMQYELDAKTGLPVILWDGERFTRTVE